MASEIRKVLCPTDWSEPSRAALRTAVRLARYEGALLVLLHVLPAMRRVPGLPSVASLNDALRHEAAQKLVAIIAESVPPDVRVSLQIRVGDQADEIYLAALECDVIVMSTQGRAQWNRWAFGSVAQTVLRETACPIFVLGPPQEAEEERANAGPVCRLNFPFERVLWPTDWSQAAARALDEAIALSARYSAQLLLLHVIEPPKLARLATQEWWDAQDAEARANFAALDEQKPAIKDAPHLLAHGLAAPEINRVAQREVVDVIVMSSHRHSGQREGELGSVTRKVLRLVPCPVLLIPGAAL